MDFPFHWNFYAEQTKTTSKYWNSVLGIYFPNIIYTISVTNAQQLSCNWRIPSTTNDNARLQRGPLPMVAFSDGYNQCNVLTKATTLSSGHNTTSAIPQWRPQPVQYISTRVTTLSSGHNTTNAVYFNEGHCWRKISTMATTNALPSLTSLNLLGFYFHYHQHTRPEVSLSAVL